MERDRNGLTHCQAAVYEQVIKGLTNKEVASVLGLGEGGVKYHVTTIFKVMRVKNRQQLILKSLKEF